MKTTAIIAEYNPFHNGHQYQIEETRKQTHADFILVLMSGDFVQRGAPALCNKYLRAKMALLGGADVVLELPSIYALSSAEFFAEGAVTLLDQLQVVDTLSFGSEAGVLSPFETCAFLLNEQGDAIEARIKEGLRQGLPYPAARAAAVSALFPDFPSLFSTPNNILGLEYCKALVALQSNIRPFTLKRKDDGYHSPCPAQDQSCAYAHACASASAIRDALKTFPGEIRSYVPARVYALLEENGLLASPLTEDAFSSLLHYKLLMEHSRGFSQYLDCTPDLSDKIIKHLDAFTGFTDFCRLLKSREITYTRLSRIFMHILLEIKTPEFFAPPFSHRQLFTPYARLLGFQKNASPLLKAIKKSSRIPLLSKPADARCVLSDEAFAMLEQDVLCASIYEAAASRHTGKPPLNELRQSPIILS